MLPHILVGRFAKQSSNCSFLVRGALVCRIVFEDVTVSDFVELKLVICLTIERVNLSLNSVYWIQSWVFTGRIALKSFIKEFLIKKFFYKPLNPKLIIFISEQRNLVHWA